MKAAILLVSRQIPKAVYFLIKKLDFDAGKVYYQRLTIGSVKYLLHIFYELKGVYERLIVCTGLVFFLRFF
jgi:hypothetical protein